MKSKKYIVTGEEQFGFPRGSHEPIVSTIWNIEKIPCIKYSESIESMSQKEILWFGLHALQSTNIFDTVSGEVRTLSYMSSIRWTSSKILKWVELTSKVYPIYDINNQYIGYIDNDKTNYTSLYKTHGNKHLAWIIDNKNILSVFLVYIIIVIALFVR